MDARYWTFNMDGREPDYRVGITNGSVGRCIFNNNITDTSIQNIEDIQSFGMNRAGEGIVNH